LIAARETRFAILYAGIPYDKVMSTCTNLIAAGKTRFVISYAGIPYGEVMSTRMALIASIMSSMYNGTVALKNIGEVVFDTVEEVDTCWYFCWRMIWVLSNITIPKVPESTSVSSSSVVSKNKTQMTPTFGLVMNAVSFDQSIPRCCLDYQRCHKMHSYCRLPTN
jgi:hypothetical protein